MNDLMNAEIRATNQLLVARKTTGLRHAAVGLDARFSRGPLLQPNVSSTYMELGLLGSRKPVLPGTLRLSTVTDGAIKKQPSCSSFQKRGTG
jgi:hypothetical protein